MKAYRLTELDPLTLPAFRTASADELRVLFAVKARGSASADELKNLLSLDDGDLLGALAFWRGAGVLTECAEGENRKKPIESGDELAPISPSKAAELIESENLASFIAACQATYGKELSSKDIEIILGLHDQLSLPEEYICLLLAFLSRYERKPMRYLEKVAFSLYDRGIVTVESLTEYIEKKSRDESREGRLRKLFGIGARALTKKEDESFLRWCEEYGYDDAVIGLAYDITVGATGKATVAYADKIIRRWFEAGCKSLPAVEEFIEKEKASRPKKESATKKSGAKESKAPASFDVDDMFANALARSYGSDKGSTDKKD